jgi:coenzyme F420-0:L-glutamate ligase / coenzyme F420-1:gamma-L-glutamate ligase
VIEIFAPDGIGEVGPGDDLAALVEAAVAADPHGPLRDGDIVVVTSKVVSKAEDRRLPAARREEAIRSESARTVARRGPIMITQTRGGLTLAASGVDNSNVSHGEVLLLPADPDATAEKLRERLSRVVGGRIGVVISDTAGRAWRLGQTDHAIGAAGLQILVEYAGRRDRYGNELQVTARAVADELAGAADLVKQKLTGRPVAVVRGLAELLEDPGKAGDSPGGAARLLRPPAEDMFARGTREAVLAAVCVATDQQDAYEDFVALEGQALVDAVVTGSGRTGGEAALLRRLLAEASYPSP